MKGLRPLLAGLCLLAPALAPATLHAAAKLEPTEEMAKQTRWVVNTINARHYLRDSMEKLDGAEIVEAYVESFDYNRMYFLQPQIESFRFRFADAMENFLEKGNLYAAFEIYRTFRERVKTRTDWIFERLDEPFDFTVEETFAPDREDAAWPADKEAADDLWRRRLKFELLNEMLSLASGGADEPEEDVDLEPDNPDVMENRGTDFNPEELRRLLEDEAFFEETLGEARAKLRRRYERNRAYTVDREAPEVQEAFINAMTQLFDPHSSFLSADTLESFNSSVQNSFVGIGALLQDVDGVCTIKQILPGGPAEASGKLEKEDEILAVAQGKDGEFEDVVDMQLRYIVRKIKGEKGTVVRLRIRPGDAADPSVRKVVSLVRDEVKLTANLASAELISVPANDHSGTVPVGVIELPSFYGNIGAGGTLTTTSDDVEELLGKLNEAGAEGIILDLRMNGGGLLSEAVRTAGLFIPVGPVVQVRDKDGDTDVLSDRDPRVMWNGPLIVLTSRFSASASEIVAGALQDHHRALVVGNSSTHGKGTVQEVYRMNNRRGFSFFQPKQKKKDARPVASKITIKQFYLPDGHSTQLKGVPSDIALPSVNEFLPIGESDLPHALPWDKIEPVDWSNDWRELKVDSPEEPGIEPALKEASRERRESLAEFRFLKDQIAWRRERFNQEEFTLHLAQRIGKKVREQKRIEKLDTTYEKLTEKGYSREEFLTEVAREQEAVSRKNQAETAEQQTDGGDGAETAASATAESDDGAKDSGNSAGTDPDGEGEAEDESPPFDIYLRESARIMADWILLEREDDDNNPATAGKAAKTDAKDVPAPL